MQRFRFKIHERGEDRWLTPDEYEDPEVVSRKDRQISTDVYREVWERIWPWYKELTVPCEQNKGEPRYWDDLDLAWEVVLHRSAGAPTYSVLVCDEAQDFARIEFAAAFGALEWTRYDLSGISTDRIPVVLAGDTHQTVNPSCFRWARVKVDCAQALVQNLARSDLPRLTVCELRYNYRNAPEIARLCNTIQAFRQFALGAPAELQRIWRTSQELPNQGVRRLILHGSQSILHDLLNQGVLLIGPEPYSTEEPIAAAFWRSLGVHSCESEFPSYVTPVDIKGLEQDFVAVLGFGTLFKQLGLEEVFEWRNALEDSRVPEGRRLTAEYFLNRLYVAVSRPRQGLWILETPEGWEAFWAKLWDWERTRYSSQQASQEHETGFRWTDGDAYQLVGEFEKRYLEMAQDFEKLAEEQRNPQHAERAAMYYRLHGDQASERRMLAFKAYYEDRIVEAADRMWELCQYERASDWYWEASAWEHLNRESVTPEYRRKAAYLMLEPNERRQESWVREMRKLLSEHQDIFREAYRERPREWQTWQKMAVELAKNSVLDVISTELKRQVMEILSEYRVTEGNWNRYLGHLAFQLGDFKAATEYWEKSGDTQTREFFRAMARITEYPLCLRYWESAGDIGEVIYQYDVHPTVPLPVEERGRVARAAVASNRLELALRLIAGIDARQAADIWRKLPTESTPDRKFWKPIVESMFKAVQELEISGAVSAKLDGTQEDSRESTEALNRIWTNFLFDLLLYLVEPPELVQDDWIWPPIVYGFSCGVFADGLRSRLERSWKGRHSESARWALFAKILCNLVAQSVKECELCHEEGDWERAVNLCEMVLDLMFRWHVRPRREQAIGDQRVWEPFYTCVPIFGSESAANGGFFDIDPHLRTAFSKALHCISQAPPEWGEEVAKKLEKQSTKRAQFWKDRLEAVSHALIEQLRDFTTIKTDPKLLPTFEEALEAGKFVEQSPFRLAAVNFYRELIELAEEHRWSPQQIKQVQQRLGLAERRHQQFAEFRDRPIVHPGEEKQSEKIRVRSLEDRPEAVIEVLPDLYRVRLRYRSDAEVPTVTSDDEINVSGPSLHGEDRRWELIWRDVIVEIVWEAKDRERIFIRADRNFQVLLAMERKS